MINDKMVRLLAYVTGLVNQKLLQNEYLIADPFSAAEAHVINRSAKVYSGGNWQRLGRRHSRRSPGFLLSLSSKM